MLTNKWVQATLIGGFGFGLWIASWLSIIHPFLPFILAYPFFFWSLFVISNARGTDGWGGPYNNPKDKG